MAEDYLGQAHVAANLRYTYEYVESVFIAVYVHTIFGRQGVKQTGLKVNILLNKYF